MRRHCLRQSLQCNFRQKLELIQYNVSVALTRAITGTSKEKLFEELVLESLQRHRLYRTLILFYFILFSYFYKFFKNFYTTSSLVLLNPVCNCRLNIKSPSYYLLHCPTYSIERYTLLTTLENIANNFIEPISTKTLFLGSYSFNVNTNANILNATIEYVISTKRFF